MEQERMDVALANIELRLQQIKRTIEELLMSLEFPTVTWTDVVNKFSSIASEFSLLQASLRNSAVPSGQVDNGHFFKTNLIVPQRVALDADPYLREISQGRITSWNHETVPNYLKTKLSADLEAEATSLELERQGQRNPDTVMKQIAALNKHIDTLCNQLGPENTTKNLEKRREQPTYSNEDTLRLVKAITRGVGIQPKHGGSTASESRSSSINIIQPNPTPPQPAPPNVSITNAASGSLPLSIPSQPNVPVFKFK